MWCMAEFYIRPLERGVRQANLAHARDPQALPEVTPVPGSLNDRLTLLHTPCLCEFRCAGWTLRLGDSWHARTARPGVLTVV